MVFSTENLQNLFLCAIECKSAIAAQIATRKALKQIKRGSINFVVLWVAKGVQ
jgi:hypothetical protein